MCVPEASSLTSTYLLRSQNSISALRLLGLEGGPGKAHEDELGHEAGGGTEDEPDVPRGEGPDTLLASGVEPAAEEGKTREREGPEIAHPGGELPLPDLLESKKKWTAPSAVSQTWETFGDDVSDTNMSVFSFTSPLSLPQRFLTDM